MSYKRRVVEKPETDHPLITLFGMHNQFNSYANDTGWHHHELHDLNNDGAFSLSQIKTTLESVRNLDVSDYKSEIAAKRKAEPVRNARIALLSFLKKHIDKARLDVVRVGNEILRLSEPVRESDSTMAMLSELKSQEIRELIRSADPKDRTRMIRGNVDFIRAVISSPDELIDPAKLHEIRREYAFSQDPSLIDYEKDTHEIYKSVRRRAGEVNGTAIRLLLDEKLDDPITPEEHFQVFTPDDSMTAELANRRIHAHEQEVYRKDREKAFDSTHPNLNVGIRRAAGFTEPKEKLQPLKRRV